MDFILKIIIVLFMIGLPLTGCIVLVQRIIYFFNHDGWEVTKGVIVESQVRSGADSAYYPHIVYEYNVNDTQYKSAEIVLGGVINSTNKKAKQYVEKYYLNKDVEVTYKSSNPQISFLEVGKNCFAYYFGISIFLIFFATGIYLIFNMF
ncbi:MAG: DUF3592 domain-containing protein [Bacillota bacterium]